MLGGALTLFGKTSLFRMRRPALELPDVTPVVAEPDPG